MARAPPSGEALDALRAGLNAAFARACAPLVDAAFAQRAVIEGLEELSDGSPERLNAAGAVCDAISAAVSRAAEDRAPRRASRWGIRRATEEAEELA